MTLAVYGIADANIASDAAVKASKLEGEFCHRYTQTGTVAAATEDIHIVRGVSGSILGLRAAITQTIATGGDRTVDVDLQKSTGAGAFATVLSATLQFTSASTLRLATSATLSTTTLAALDILRIVVTVAGAAGNQAVRLAVEVFTREDAA